MSISLGLTLELLKFLKSRLGLGIPAHMGKKFRIKIYLDLLFKSGFQTYESPDRDLEFAKILFFLEIYDMLVY